MSQDITSVLPLAISIATLFAIVFITRMTPSPKNKTIDANNKEVTGSNAKDETREPITAAKSKRDQKKEITSSSAFSGMESFKRTSFVLLGVIFLYLFILLVDTTASTVIFCFVIMIMCYVYARGYSQKIQNIQTHLESAISQVQFLSSHPSQLDNIKLSLCNNEAIGTCSSAFFSQVFRASNIGWQVPGLIANNEQLISLRSPRDFFYGR